MPHKYRPKRAARRAISPCAGELSTCRAAPPVVRRPFRNARRVGAGASRKTARHLRHLLSTHTGDASRLSQSRNLRANCMPRRDRACTPFGVSGQSIANRRKIEGEEVGGRRSPVARTIRRKLLVEARKIIGQARRSRSGSQHGWKVRGSGNEQRCERCGGHCDSLDAPCPDGPRLAHRARHNPESAEKPTAQAPCGKGRRER